MPKLNCLKSGKCLNLNKWGFVFRHVPILNVWALKFSNISRKSKHLVFGDLGPNRTILGLIVPNLINLVRFSDNCPKTESFVPIVLLQVWFGFWTDSKNRTVWNWAKSWMSKNKTSLDFGRWLYLSLPTFCLFSVFWVWPAFTRTWWRPTWLLTRTSRAPSPTSARTATTILFTPEMEF